MLTAETDIKERPQSAGEELANAVSHGVALAASLAVLPVLIVSAVRHGGAASITAASIFGGTMLLLYLNSTLYHALPDGRGKRLFLVLDHCAIFLLIAGTYTPFALGALRGAWGWSLFGVVWGLAIVGIVSKTVFTASSGTFSTCLYLVMGWLIIIAVQPLINTVPLAGLLWLLAGGLAYTLGVVFFLLGSRIRYSHFVWHLFVAAGSFCHLMAVMGYAR